MPKAKNLQSFQRLFWFNPDIDLEKNRHLLVHHVLAYGNLVDWKKMFSLYRLADLKKEFLEPVKGIYDLPSLKLAQRFLGVNLKNEKAYLKKVK